MKQIIVVVALAMLLCGLAAAQSSAYTFIGPGMFQAGIHGISGEVLGENFGAGARLMTKSGVGFGVEMSGVTSRPNEEFGMGGGNAYYDFKAEGKTVPFIGGGYLRSFGHGWDENWVSMGGGVNYWVHRKTGLLVEARDYLHYESGHTAQVLCLRMGLSFK